MQFEQFPLPGFAPAPAVSAATGRGWLSAEVILMEALAVSPMLNAVLARAAYEERKNRSLRGAFGERVDQRVGKLLTPQVAAVISDEVVRSARPTVLGLLSSVQFEHVPGRGPVDLWVTFRFASTDRPLVHEIPVNLKVVSPDGADSDNDALSLRRFLFHLTEPGIKPWRTAMPPGWSPSNAITELDAGQRKVQHGRSYWLLVAHVDADGTVRDLHSHGLISHVDAHGRLLLSRNSVRDSVESTGMPVAPIPDDMDINRAIVRAVRRRPDVAVLREQFVAMAPEADQPERARKALRITAAQLEVEVAELFSRVR